MNKSDANSIQQTGTQTDNNQVEQFQANCFMPDKSMVRVLKHLCKAVLPLATQAQRAINLYGKSCAGKSHFAAVIAQLLCSGSDGNDLATFFQHLSDAGEADLVLQLKKTFLSTDSLQAKPYFLVSIDACNESTLNTRLLQGLHNALEKFPKLNNKSILPTTRYEACVKRFEEITADTPKLADAKLSQWQLTGQYTSTKEIYFYLKRREPAALELFKRWHPLVCNGAVFAPPLESCKNIAELYLKAGKYLAVQHNFSGILLIWDDFEPVLDELINNPLRQTVDELLALQNFVENVCRPSQAYTLIFLVTELPFTKYVSNSRVLKQRAKNRNDFSGNFIESQFEIKVSIEINEQKKDTGLPMTEPVATQSNPFDAVIDLCRQLPLFDSLDIPIADIVTELQAVLVSVLFNLSSYAELEHVRDCTDGLSEDEVFECYPIIVSELVNSYIQHVKENANRELQSYQMALIKIAADLPLDEIKSKKTILKILLLAQLLGEHNQLNEGFLTRVIEQLSANKISVDQLKTDLMWLATENLIKINDLTQLWSLSEKTENNFEALIDYETSCIAECDSDSIFREHKLLLDELFSPHTGIHYLAPSASGIVRPYMISLLTSVLDHDESGNFPTLTARVYLMWVDNTEDAEKAKIHIEEMAEEHIYFCLSLADIEPKGLVSGSRILLLENLIYRYLALDILQHQYPVNEELQRVLQTKKTKTRRQLQDLYLLLYGDESIATDKTIILKAGVKDNIHCNNWLEFRNILGGEIQKAYFSEVILGTSKGMSIPGFFYRLDEHCGTEYEPLIIEVIQRILNFASNSVYQTNLLGELDDSSEISFVCNGLLAANQLFIKRDSYWDIKLITETDGAINKVLTLIHDTLLAKRDKPFVVSRLSKELVAAPYGIPTACLAIFAAIALRFDCNNLRFGKTKEIDFAKNLSSAFSVNSQLTLRSFEFNPKQFAILFALAKCFNLVKNSEQTQEEYVTHCNHKLHDFVKQQPEAIKNSASLPARARRLVVFIQEENRTPSVLADFLCELLDLEHDSVDSIVSKAQVLQKEMLNDFVVVANARRLAIEQCWQTVIPETKMAKNQLLTRLNHQQSTERAKAVAELLSQQINSKEVVDANKITQTLLNKQVDQCSDMEIGQCLERLESLVEFYQQALMPATEEKQQKNVVLTIQKLVLLLRQQIESSQLPPEAIQQALNQVRTYTKVASSVDNLRDKE